MFVCCCDVLSKIDALDKIDAIDAHPTINKHAYVLYYTKKRTVNAIFIYIYTQERCDLA